MILAHDASGDGAPAVLLHGLGLTRAIFDPLAILSTRARIIRLDLRGHGRSQPADPAEPYRHHEDVVATLDALELDRVDVVGLSLGGGVAVDLALAHPGRVRRLVLLAPALSGWAWSDAWIAAFRTVRAVARESGPRAALEAWAAHPLFATTRERANLARALEAMIFADSGRRWLERDASQPLEPPAAGRLSELAASTHVIVGERDLPDFRAIAETMATHVRRVRLLVVPGAGHLLPLEAPGKIVPGIAQGLSDDLRPRSAPD
jgi:pimeloyl-ACP methyl ester carboxylesterase